MSSLDLSSGLVNHLKVSDYQKAKVGGQKTVFIVTIDSIQYALKILNIADERFHREVKICEQFDTNPGIPKIIKVEEFEGDTLILEEYIDGNDLSDISEDYINKEYEVISLISNVIDILEPVWNENFVHRDIKPQNIRVRKNGEIVVLDFGIARAINENSLTATGTQPLSWTYASPEQILGKKELISYRTDFFSLGILTYFLFSGTLPFGESVKEIQQLMSTPTVPLCFSQCGSDKIDNFCKATLTHNPSDRPRTIKMLKSILLP